MSDEFTLAKAFVELSTRGAAEVTRQLEVAKQQVNRFNAGASSAQVALDYARTRGLQVAGKDAETLVKKFVELKDLRAFDSWIDKQKVLQTNLKTLKTSLEEIRTLATYGFATLTASITGFTMAASPAHWDTLSDSIKLVSARIGTLFLPVVEMAINFFDNLGDRLARMDQATKDQIVRWTLWGGAISGAVVFGSKLLSFVSPLVSGFKLLSSAIQLATGSTFALTVAGRGLMLTPFGAVLAGVAAIGGLLAMTPEGRGTLGGVANGLAEAFRYLVPAIQAATTQLNSLASGTAQVLDSPILGEAGGENGPTTGEVLSESVPFMVAAISDSAHLMKEIFGIGMGQRALTGRNPLDFGGLTPAMSARYGDESHSPMARMLSGVGAIGRAVEQGSRNRGIQPHFQGQMGGIEMAWRRLQQAALGGTEREREIAALQANNQATGDLTTAMRRLVDLFSFGGGAGGSGGMAAAPMAQNAVNSIVEGFEAIFQRILNGGNLPAPAPG